MKEDWSLIWFLKKVMHICKPRIYSHWSYADAKKEVLWLDPTRYSWSCLASPSHVFPCIYFPLVVKQFSMLTAVTFTNNKHYGLLDLSQKGSWICVCWLTVAGPVWRSWCACVPSHHITRRWKQISFLKICVSFQSMRQWTQARNCVILVNATFYILWNLLSFI